MFLRKTATASLTVLLVAGVAPVAAAGYLDGYATCGRAVGYIQVEATQTNPNDWMTVKAAGVRKKDNGVRLVVSAKGYRSGNWSASSTSLASASGYCVPQ